MTLLIAIQDNECWIDKYANWYTFGGFILAIVGIVLTVYFYKKQQTSAKKKKEADAESQREVVELQTKALALEEEKMKNEVKPVLYIEGVLTNQIDRVVKVTFGNNNPKAHLHFVSLRSLTEGWQMVTKNILDMQSTSVMTVSLTYTAGKNCENFDIEFDVEDLYHNKYILQIHSTYKNQLITLLPVE